MSRAKNSRQDPKSKKGLRPGNPDTRKAERGHPDVAVEIQGRKTGRPTKYRPEYCKQAHGHCLLGATNEDLAKFFEVNPDTIAEWMKVHPSFSDAIKSGREEADNKVARSLYERALGFEHDEEVIMQYQGDPIRVKTKKKYPPDPTAMIFWLKNRRPDLWRDRVEHTGRDGSPLIPPPIIRKG